MYRTDSYPLPKNRFAPWVMLVLLLQFFSFTGFSDLAPVRDTATQSEATAHFAPRYAHSLSFRKAVRGMYPQTVAAADGRYALRIYNQKTETRFSACLPQTAGCLCILPPDARPRAATDDARA